MPSPVFSREKRERASDSLRFVKKWGHRYVYSANLIELNQLVIEIKFPGTVKKEDGPL